MKKLAVFLAVTILFFSQSILAVEIDAGKRELIDKILEQTGQTAITVGEQFSGAFIQQMTIVLKAGNPDIDPRAFYIMEEEIKKLVHEELVINKAFFEMMYPIYDKHFTIEDLKKMIELNNTPFGKKMIKVMPLITQEGMQAGQAFGQSLGPKIQQRIITRFEEEGIVLP